MPIFAHPFTAALAARVMQQAAKLAVKLGQRTQSESVNPRLRFREFPRRTRDLSIPTSIGPAAAVVYTPEASQQRPAVHVNLHGGGFVFPQLGFDDPMCRYLAAEAGVVVIDVDYAVAPQHAFPAPARQAFEVVQWVAAHGAEQGWDGSRVSVGGQSSGGSLAAAAARQALSLGGPAITLQVLHYAPFDLAMPIRSKHSTIKRPQLRPWLCDIFNNAYVQNTSQLTDPLVSPAHSSDTADLTGIAPALIITADQDVLHAEGKRYAERLDRCGALSAYHEIANADHAYDMRDISLAREVYGLMAQHIQRAARGHSSSVSAAAPA